MNNRSVSIKQPALPVRLWQWLVNDKALYGRLSVDERQRLDYFRLGFFVLMHLACLGVLWVGTSWTAVLVAIFLYLIRMFFITAFYHRYFSHRSYMVSRAMQLLMAIAGCTAGQRGPLWWASHHRAHHANSDANADPHSPRHGFLHSHLLWFLRPGNFSAQDHRIRDLLRYPELRVLEKIGWLPFVLLFPACYALGHLLEQHYPAMNTNGWQLLIWGGFVSTVFLYHATYTINSLAHICGSRRFNTRDDSRNNYWLALLTLGEGWHNNHHRYPVSAMQGFYHGETDVSYMLLRALAAFGLVSNFRAVPASVLEEGRRK